MADLPELKFDDDLPELDFGDEPAAPAAEPTSEPGPQKISDADFDKMRPDLVGDFNRQMADVREGTPLAGAAQKLGALVGPGGYDAGMKRVKDERADRHKVDPDGASRREMLGAALAPNVGGAWWSRILGNSGLAATDAATRADSVQEAKKDATEAGILAGGIEALMSSLGGAGKMFKGVAEDRAVKSLGPTLSQQRVLNDRGAARELGREMLDEGVVRFGSSVEGMAPRLEDLLADKGRRIGDIRSAADEAGAQIDLSRLRDIGNAKVAFSDATNEATQKAAKSYAKNAEALARVPERSIGEVQGEIAALSKQIPFEKDLAKHTPAQQAFGDLRRDMVGQVDDQVRQRVPDSFDEYQKLKSQFGLLKEGDKILDQSVARQQRNADIGLRDLLVGNMAKKEGNSALGVAGAVASKIARERGNSMAAATANRMSQILGANPAGLGKFAKPLMDAARRGNTSLMATHAMLMDDPEYAALVETPATPNRAEQVRADSDAFASKYGTDPDALQEPGIVEDSFIPNSDHEMAAKGWALGAAPAPPAFRAGAAGEAPTLDYGQQLKKTITQATTGFKPAPGVKIAPDSSLSTEALADLLKKMSGTK